MSREALAEATDFRDLVRTVTHSRPGSSLLGLLGGGGQFSDGVFRVFLFSFLISSSEVCVLRGARERSFAAAVRKLEVYSAAKAVEKSLCCACAFFFLPSSFALLPFSSA